MKKLCVSLFVFLFFVPVAAFANLEPLVELGVNLSKVEADAPCAFAVAKAVHSLPSSITDKTLMQELISRRSEALDHLMEMHEQLSQGELRPAAVPSPSLTAKRNILTPAKRALLLKHIENTFQYNENDPRSTALIFKGQDEINSILNGMECSAQRVSDRHMLKHVCARAAGVVAVAGGLITAFIAAKSAQYSVWFDQPSFAEALLGIKHQEPDLSEQNFWAANGFIAMGAGALSWVVSFFTLAPEDRNWPKFLQTVRGRMGEQTESADPQFFTIEQNGKSADLIYWAAKSEDGAFEPRLIFLAR